MSQKVGWPDLRALAFQNKKSVKPMTFDFKIRTAKSNQNYLHESGQLPVKQDTHLTVKLSLIITKKYCDLVHNESQFYLEVTLLLR